MWAAYRRAFRDSGCLAWICMLLWLFAGWMMQKRRRHIVLCELYDYCQATYDCLPELVCRNAICVPQT